MGSWLADAGSLGAIIAFTLGGLIMLPLALCYAEMAGMYPVSGGEVAYIYKAYGELPAFAAGWLLAFLYISATAFEAISVGWVLSAMFPSVNSPILYSFLGADVTLFALFCSLFIMGVITYINLSGAKSTALFQHIVTALLIVSVAIFVMGGLSKAEPAHIEPLFVGGSTVGALKGVIILLATTPFWFAGFDTIPQAMEEIADKKALKLLPYVMAAAIGLATLFYIIVILTTSLVAPREDILGAELPLAIAIEAALGPIGKQLVLFAGLCGLITTWNAVFFAASRIIFAMGRARMIPPFFGKIGERRGTPAIAVWFVGIVAGLATLMGREAIIIIIGATALGFSLLMLLVVHGVARLRTSTSDHPRPFKFPGGMAGLRATTLIAFAIFSLAFFTPLISSGGKFPYEWVSVIAWMAIGALFWIFSTPMRVKLSKDERRRLVLDESD